MAIQLFKTGAFGTDDPTQIIQLHAKIATDGQVCTFRKPFASAGYQVSVGKTLHIVKMIVMGSGNPGWWKLGYADNDVGFDTATARTNGVMSIGVDDAGTNGLNLALDVGQIGASNSGTVAAAEVTPFFWALSISAKFPFARRVGAAPNSYIIIWGVEL